MKTIQMPQHAEMILNDPGRPHAMYGISMILAPLLQTISGFFWTSGEYGVTGGTILIISALFWIPTLIILPPTYLGIKLLGLRNSVIQ